MLMGTLRIDVLRDIKRGPFFKAFIQGGLKLLRDNVVLETEIDLCPGTSIKYVICLLLSQDLAKILLYVFLMRMALDGQVAAVKIVKIVHADREFIAIFFMTLLSDDILSGLIHDEVERHFQHFPAAAEYQSVLRDNQFK